MKKKETHKVKLKIHIDVTRNLWNFDMNYLGGFAAISENTISELL